MKLVTNNKNYLKMRIFVLFVKKYVNKSMLKIIKLGTIVIIQVNIELLHKSHVKYRVPKEIPIIFRNGCNYDYFFIIKEFVDEFQRQLTCLG